MRRKFAILMLLGLLVSMVSTALAGGWALVSLDAPPGEVHAGTPWKVDFTVLQHGKTPTHGFDGYPLSPTLVATNSTTGERIEVAATPVEEIGRFTLDVTFPSEGMWEWTIEPRPLIGESVFEPLTVLPATVALTVAEPEPDSRFAPSAFRWAALGVAALAAVLAVVQARRREPVSVQPEG